MLPSGSGSSKLPTGRRTHYYTPSSADGEVLRQFFLRPPRPHQTEVLSGLSFRQRVSTEVYALCRWWQVLRREPRPSFGRHYVRPKSDFVCRSNRLVSRGVVIDRSLRRCRLVGVPCFRGTAYLWGSPTPDKSGFVAFDRSLRQFPHGGNHRSDATISFWKPIVETRRSLRC